MSFETYKDISVEGVVLPNSPLSNIQLIDAAKKLNIPNFRGVFLRDELPKKPRRNEFGILLECRALFTIKGDKDCHMSS